MRFGSFGMMKHRNLCTNKTTQSSQQTCRRRSISDLFRKFCQTESDGSLAPPAYYARALTIQGGGGGRTSATALSRKLLFGGRLILHGCGTA